MKNQEQNAQRLFSKQIQEHEVSAPEIAKNIEGATTLRTYQQQSINSSVERQAVERTATHCTELSNGTPDINQDTVVKHF